MTSPRSQPLGRRLPWWVTRTIGTTLGDLPCMVMKDGTLASGLRISGLDHYCAGNSAINRTAAALRGALNVLPSHGYLQAVFETGFSFAPLLNRYTRADHSTAHPVMREARKRRAAMLASAPGLSGSQLTYYLGHRKALGLLASHRTKPGGGLLGARRKHPSQVTAELVINAGEELAYTVAQVVDRLRKEGAMDYTTVVVAGASEPAPLQFIAPYAGVAMGEHFLNRGGHAL